MGLLGVVAEVSHAPNDLVRRDQLRPGYFSEPRLGSRPARELSTDERMTTECPPVAPSAPAPDCLRSAACPARNNRVDGDGDEVGGDARRMSAWQPAK
jgi:hypothetical protein